MHYGKILSMSIYFYMGNKYYLMLLQYVRVVALSDCAVFGQNESGEKMSPGRNRQPTHNHPRAE